ncbi:Hypothetical protein CINCED_3A017042 [Cinara cedri]|uniref:Small RNA 2'-O-methyltransferase n=2 Tax=Cinara cedri TaxID=506608 RepID=A0A5E4M5C2_9HEMI|nr:Hypothetical protein CINCED_3A017042 [Cinara cedri]
MLVLQSTLLSMGINAFGFLKYIVERYLYSPEIMDSKGKNRIQFVSQKTCVAINDEYGLKFFPPLYIQRYMVVQEIIDHPIWNGSIKKIVEFGCAELNLFFYLKPNPQITNVTFVDIDSNILELNNGKVMPTNYDYLISGNRKHPLEVNLYAGSIADFDDRMLDMDAVICIELIEHLYSDVLDKVPLTVFGFIKPKVAVFTTPNVEYNVLFPDTTQKFRHPDHKFEWSRNEMKEWANSIITTYPDYTVEFDGIGLDPIGTKDLGCCSQVAIFYRKNMEASPANLTGFKPYKLLKRINYPYEPPNEKNEIILQKLRSFVIENSANKEFVVKSTLKIPLSSIMPLVSDYCTCMKELQYIISKEYYTTTNKAGEWIMITNLNGTSIQIYNSDSDSSSDTSEEENWLLDNNVKEVEEEEEEWNLPLNVGTSNSQLFYSTPMAKDKHLDVQFLNSLNDTYTKSNNSTASSNSDFFTTAIDNNDTNNEDMDISSSCNGSVLIKNCNIYQDFVSGRNDLTIKNEDISETDEETFICNANYNDTNKVNEEINKKNSFIQNSTNVFLKSNCGSDIAHGLTSKIVGNFSSDDIKEPDLVCSNRILLDENNDTENLLSSLGKEIPSRNI